MNRKQALLVIVIVAIVIIAALAIFYFYFAGSPTGGPSGGSGFPISTSTYPSGGGVPTGGQGGTQSGNGGLPSGYPSNQNQPQAFKQSLREISSVPVAGATVFDMNAVTLIRYVERATGHIYETKISDSSAPYRISNTTIPKVYEALWVRNGAGVILRYLKDGTDTVQTFYTGLTPSATSTEQKLINGAFLANGISDLSISPTQDRIFYMVDSGGKTYGIRSMPDGTQKVQLLSTTAHEWLSVWPTAGTVVLTTKPSSQVPGYLYFLNTTTGGLQKILSSINGLTTLANGDTSLVLYSQTTPTGFRLELLNTKLGVVTDAPITTLPEKCVWSRHDSSVVYCAAPHSLPQGNYPDAWYQGQISFTDDIWKVNTKTGEADDILSPQSVANQAMDITNLQLSAHEDELLFQNKNDLSLWLYNLNP